MKKKTKKTKKTTPKRIKTLTQVLADFDKRGVDPEHIRVVVGENTLTVSGCIETPRKIIDLEVKGVPLPDWMERVLWTAKNGVRQEIFMQIIKAQNVLKGQFDLNF